MSRSHTLNVMLVLVLIVAASLACSFGSAPKPTVEVVQEPAPTATRLPPTPEPTATTSPTEAAPAEETVPATANAGDKTADEPGAAPMAWSGEGYLGLPKTEFTPQEPLLVTLKLNQSLPDGAWVGIVPANTSHGSASEADSYDVDYEYVNGVQEGTTELNAPGVPGAYDVRLFDPTADEGAQELTSLAITVVPHDLSQFSLQVDKITFYPGEEILVTYSAPGTLPDNAWLGLIPSGVTHGSEAEADQYDVDYQYLSGQNAGQLSLYAPQEPGSYDVRLFDTDRADGVEVASITVSVGSHDASQASLQVSKSTLTPGEEFQVSFTAPATLPENAWIGIIPADVTHGSEEEADSYDIDYEYISGQTSGSITFYAPDEPGAYDVRLFDSDSDGSELVYVSFQVR